MRNISETIGLIIVGVFIGAAFAATLEAEAGSNFYQWTTSDGQVAAADDSKSVPVMYKSSATLRDWNALFDTSNQTFLSMTSEEYRKVLQSRLADLRSRKEASKVVAQCKGVTTVTLERRDYKERGNTYNSLFYVVRDGCGFEKSASRARPLPYLDLN